MQAPHHCDEIIRLIDNVLGDLGIGHDASRSRGVHTTEEKSVIENHVCADSNIVCRPAGDLDWIGAVSLRHLIHDLLRPGVDIIIDLSRVDYVDAVGMSTLVGSVRRVRAAGGTAEICKVSSQIRRRMGLAGVDRLLMRPSASNGHDGA